MNIFINIINKPVPLCLKAYAVADNLYRMKHMIKFILLLAATFGFYSTNAETWDEPWQKEIIQQSDLFILGKIVETHDSLIVVQVVKNFAAPIAKDEIIIDGFFMLNLMSSSGHGVHFPMEQGDMAYLFLHKRENGNYALPTPTSGFAFLNEDDKVKATYRHSYHQALVPKDIYELTYQQIWHYYKAKEFDQKEMMKFVHMQLQGSPAGFDDAEIDQFFLQHVAMETAYLLDMNPDVQLVLKFAASENFHARVSAIRLLGNSHTAESKAFLFSTLARKEYGNFEKVMAIWSLKKIGDEVYISKLKEIKDTLSDEYTGFGGDIMDPRMATFLPSPKRAVEDL